MRTHLPPPIILSCAVISLVGCGSTDGGTGSYGPPDGGTPAIDGAMSQSTPDGSALQASDAAVSSTNADAAGTDARGSAGDGANTADVSGGLMDATAPPSDSAATIEAGNDGAKNQGVGDSSTDASSTQVDTGTTTPANLFVGYYQTWSDQWKANGADTVLAHLPSYVNVVNLAFMQPNTTYAQGSVSLSGTGVSVPYDGPTLKAAIAALHGNSPSTKVLVSVGGATYTAWSAFSAPAVAAFVADFGLDGVDIDYEPSNPNCSNATGAVICPSSDAEYVSVVSSMRSAMPRPKWLSIAAWSVGAYGEGQWANAPPTGSPYLGIALAVSKDIPASAALDLVNVMSYDAGPAYVPSQALQAYRHYFTGRIAMGVEVPPEAWGGHVETLPEIDALAAVVQSSGAAGMMLWSLQKPGSAQQFASEICTKLGLGNCSAPL
jgi:chitinase